jgi:hypothetical protein
MIRYFYQNVVIWLLHFFYYFLQDYTVGINIIMFVNWRSQILANIYFSSAWYINSICYTVGFTSLMNFICDWKTSIRIPQEIEWKFLNILSTLSYNTVTGLPTTVTKPQLHMEMKMVIHLHAEMSVTDKQLCEAFFEYIYSNYYYILLFL